MPLAAQGSDFGALATVLRGARVSSCVGASLRESPVASVEFARVVATSAVPAIPLAHVPAAPSMVTTYRASSSASSAVLGTVVPATATAGATSSPRALVGASLATATAASPMVATGPSVGVVPTGEECTALLLECVLVRGRPKNVRRAVIVCNPNARHQTHDFSPPLYLPSVVSYQHPCLADG